jgi:hypothetical protein
MYFKCTTYIICYKCSYGKIDLHFGWRLKGENSQSVKTPWDEEERSRTRTRGSKKIGLLPYIPKGHVKV